MNVPRVRAEKAVDHCHRVPEMDAFIVCEDHV